MGADGSPGSLAALTFASPLAAAWSAALLVAVVVEPEAPDSQPADQPGDAGDVDHRAQVAGWFARLGLPPPDEVLILSGPPGPALADAAREQGVDLVIAGAEGTPGGSGPRFGSTANLLAHRVDVPFLAIPVGCRWRALFEVVVGLDDSPGAAAAVRFVAALPGVDTAIVHAVHACQPLTQWAGDPVPASLVQRAEHDAALWTAPLDDRARAVRLRVRDRSHPSTLLLEVADEVHADLVVVGVQPTGRITGHRPGRTVFEVLERATRPTLLVPPPPA